MQNLTKPPLNRGISWSRPHRPQLAQQPLSPSRNSTLIKDSIFLEAIPQITSPYVRDLNQLSITSPPIEPAISILT